jgi:molybdopterin synthase sulfur carrier subunit
MLLLYTFAMRISFYATLRKIVGEKHIELPLPEQCSLVQILSAVVDAYPELREEVLDENGELDRYIHLFVNGRSSKFLPEKMDTVVDGSQSIEFFPAVAGG